MIQKMSCPIPGRNRVRAVRKFYRLKPEKLGDDVIAGLLPYCELDDAVGL